MGEHEIMERLEALEARFAELERAMELRWKRNGGWHHLLKLNNQFTLLLFLGTKALMQNLEPLRKQVFMLKEEFGEDESAKFLLVHADDLLAHLDAANELGERGGLPDHPPGQS